MKMISKYKIVLDFGKPFEESYADKKEVIKRLKQIKKLYIQNKDKYPYFDVFVYEDNIDITDKISN